MYTPYSIASYLIIIGHMFWILATPVLASHLPFITAVQNFTLYVFQNILKDILPQNVKL